MNSGIYKILNLINNRVYIGQAINIHSRLRDHKECLYGNRHANEHLQNAWNKYGSDAFEFSIIEECEEDKLTEREQYWIDYYGGINSDKTYNQRDAGSHGKHSDESKLKISLSQKGISKSPGRKVSEYGKKILSESHMGIIPSLETRKKMSLAQKGRKHTEITKKKIGDANRQKYIDNPELRKEVSNRMKGRIFSKEHRERLGLIHKGKYYKNNSKLIKKHSDGLKQAYRSGRKKAIWITVRGVTKMQSEWADILNVAHTSLIYQRKKGDGYVEKYIEELLIKKDMLDFLLS